MPKCQITASGEKSPARGADVGTSEAPPMFLEGTRHLGEVLAGVSF